jgi:hypothetical protein
VLSLGPRGQQPSVRGKGHARALPLRMSFQGSRLLSGLHLPQDHRAGPRDPEASSLPSGEKATLMHPLLYAPSGFAPAFRSPRPTGSPCRSSISRGQQAVHPGKRPRRAPASCMPLQGSHLLSGLHVPQDRLLCQRPRPAAFHPGKRPRSTPPLYALPGSAPASRSPRPTESPCCPKILRPAVAHSGKRPHSAPTPYALSGFALAFWSPRPTGSPCCPWIPRPGAAHPGKRPRYCTGHVCPSRVRACFPASMSHRITVPS